MSKSSVDAICKIILNFLLWSVLAAAFFFSSGFGTELGANISEIFKGGFEHFPALAWIGAAVALIFVTIVVAKGIRAQRNHQNELVGDLVDEIGSVAASFGSVLFFAAATDWKLILASFAAWALAWLLFKWAIKLGA